MTTRFFPLFIGIALSLLGCGNLQTGNSPAALNPATNTTTQVAAHFSSHPSIIEQSDCLEFFRQKHKPPFANQIAHMAAGWFGRLESEFVKEMKTLDCFRFVYRVDQVMVEGYVVKPKQTQPRALPAIIFNRGGNPNLATITVGTLQYTHVALAKQGFVVISSQYRGANIWPKDINFDIGRDEYGGKDVNDVTALIPILEKMPDVDPGRIGMMGASRGGMMTYLASKNNPKIKTLVVWAGVADMLADLPFRPEFDTHLYPRLIPGYPGNKEQALRDRSVLFWLDEINIKMPILLLHGDADTRVSVTNSIKLAEKLKQRGHPHKLIVYPKADHDLEPFQDQAMAEIVKWFEMYL